MQVRADIYADGHDLLRAVLLYKPGTGENLDRARMRLINNDRWGAEFAVEELGRYIYTLAAWVDEWGSWSAGLRKKWTRRQEVSMDVLVGVELLQAAARRAHGADAKKLTDAAAQLKDVAARDKVAAVKLVEDTELAAMVNRNRGRDADTRYEQELAVVVDPVRARFSTWYEMFPRSVTTDPKRHGTFRDCIDRLRYIAEWDLTFCTCRRFIRSA